jgi:hypothetical protein
VRLSQSFSALHTCAKYHNRFRPKITEKNTTQSQGRNWHTILLNSSRSISRCVTSDITAVDPRLTQCSEGRERFPCPLRKHVPHKTSQRITSLVATGAVVRGPRFLEHLERSPCSDCLVRIFPRVSSHLLLIPILSDAHPFATVVLHI